MNIRKVWNWLWNPPTDGPQATVLIRMMTGGVFLWEGILKFVYTNQGVGRFTKLGIPFPGPTAHFVAWVEIIGGTLFMLGWLTRPVAVAFIIEMIVAILSTKISLFLGTFPLPLPPSPPQAGMWAVLHEVRSEYAQIMTSIFLLIAGPGPIALDAKRVKESNGLRRSRLAAVSVLLLLMAGTVRASGSASAGASAVRAVSKNFTLGQKAIKKEDYRGAAQFFRRALAEQPNNPDVLNMLAFCELWLPKRLRDLKVPQADPT